MNNLTIQKQSDKAYIKSGSITVATITKNNLEDSYSFNLRCRDAFEREKKLRNDIFNNHKEYRY